MYGGTGQCRALGFGSRVSGYTGPIQQNQMDKKMENQMEAEIIRSHRDWRFQKIMGAILGGSLTKD